MILQLQLQIYNSTPVKLGGVSLHEQKYEHQALWRAL